MARLAETLGSNILHASSAISISETNNNNLRNETNVKMPFLICLNNMAT